MTYEEARNEVQRSDYTSAQARALHAAIDRLEQQQRPVPIWSGLEDLAFGEPPRLRDDELR